KEELAGFAAFFFIAAVVTTAGSISFMARTLLETAPLAAQLREHPSKVPGFAREVLRLSSPVQYVAREAGMAFHISNKTIRAGQGFLLVLAAANRDASFYSTPVVLDIGREGPEILTFAAGPYRCVETHLATFEVELAAKKLLEHTNLKLSPEPPVWESRMNIAA